MELTPVLFAVAAAGDAVAVRPGTPPGRGGRGPRRRRDAPARRPRRADRRGARRRRAHRRTPAADGRDRPPAVGRGARWPSRGSSGRRRSSAPPCSGSTGSARHADVRDRLRRRSPPPAHDRWRSPSPSSLVAPWPASSTKRSASGRHHSSRSRRAWTRSSSRRSFSDGREAALVGPGGDQPVVDLGVPLDAPHGRRMARGLHLAGARRREADGALGEIDHHVVVPVHRPARAEQAAHQLVVDGLGGPPDVEQAELTTLRVHHDLASQRDRAELVAEADAERRDARVGRRPDEVADGRQPRRLLVVVGSHRPAHHDQSVVPVDRRRHRVTVVRAADGEVDAVHPGAHQVDRVVVLVLDDQHAWTHSGNLAGRAAHTQRRTRLRYSA